MGITNSTDVFQSVMNVLFQDAPVVEYFIDDIGIFANDSFDHHLSIVHHILLRLGESGFTINPIKCAWVMQSIDYLGFLLTTDGIKPLAQKMKQLATLYALQPQHTYDPLCA